MTSLASGQFTVTPSFPTSTSYQAQGLHDDLWNLLLPPLHRPHPCEYQLLRVPFSSCFICWRQPTQTWYAYVPSNMIVLTRVSVRQLPQCSKRMKRGRKSFLEKEVQKAKRTPTANPLTDLDRLYCMLKDLLDSVPKRIGEKVGRHFFELPS